MLSKLQRSNTENQRLAFENTKIDQSLTALQRSLEEKSAEHYRECELLKLSHQKEKEKLVQVVSASSGSCPNCPVLLQKITELQNVIAGLMSQVNALKVDLESLRSAANIRANSVNQQMSAQFQLEREAFRSQLEQSEAYAEKLRASVADANKKHKHKLESQAQALLHSQQEQENLFQQMENQAEGMTTLRGELTDYANECARLRRVPAGAGGFPACSAPGLPPSGGNLHAFRGST